MMQVIECNCGETEMNMDCNCKKCGRYRGPTLASIMNKINDFENSMKKDLQILIKHMENSK